MIETLVNLLKTFGYGVYQQGSFTSEEEYPNAFFTYTNDDTETLTHYDNKEASFNWIFTIYFYSTSPLLTVEMINKAKTLLQENKWIVPGKGNDIYSDSKNHSGRMIEAYYIERNEEV